MVEKVFINEGKYRVSKLLEGFLYALGEVCHGLFGSRGEKAVYKAIGSFFLAYLKDNLGIEFQEKDPWKRYCRIVEVLTQLGFYSYVELDELDDGGYWILETGRYAGSIWDEQESCQRSFEPCPLYAVILHSLSEIGYTIVLDEVSSNEESDGFESWFHFERILPAAADVLQMAEKELRDALLPICPHCRKVKEDDGTWIDFESYLEERFEANVSRTVCPECAVQHYRKDTIQSLFVH